MLTSTIARTSVLRSIQIASSKVIKVNPIVPSLSLSTSKSSHSSYLIQAYRGYHQSTILKMSSTTELSTYRFNHTMIRVKDPEKSIKFYTEILGMELIDEHDGGDFKLFFLGYNTPASKGLSRGEREGLLELTWNKGTEKDESFQYHNGNDEPKGFGHTCVSVDNIEAACERFEKMGVQFKKRLQDGKMHNIAFIYDPDNYWVEIISHNKPQ